MNRIGIGIAAAAISITGLASTATAVTRLTTSGDHHSAEVAAQHDDTAATVSVDGLPGASVLDGIAVPDAAGLVATATDLAADAQGLVPGVSDITSKLPAVPNACSAALPVALPLPSNIFAAGMSLTESLQALAASHLDALPAGAPDVLGMAEGQVGCLAGTSSAGPVPSVCSVSGTVPSSLPAAVPGAVAGVLSAATQDLGAISGQGVTVNSGNSIGVNCTTAVIESTLAKAPVLPSAPALPALPSAPGIPAVPAVPSLPEIDVPQLPADVTDMTETLGTVTDTVDTLLGSVPVEVPALPVLDCSANASGGLLGSLKASVTGTC